MPLFLYCFVQPQYSGCIIYGLGAMTELKNCCTFIAHGYSSKTISEESKSNIYNSISKLNGFRAKLGKKSFVCHQHYIAIHAGVAIAIYCNRQADCNNKL